MVVCYRTALTLTKSSANDLDPYRGKRDPTRTNEPFGAERINRVRETWRGDFVVHQHGARGLPAEFLGVPLEATPEDRDARIGIAQISRYAPGKGVAYGSPALNAILKEHANVHVSLLGTCCEPEHVLQDFAPEVRDRVKVVPRYEHHDLPALLRGHHIKVFPTLAEGFGNALLEAMSCGLAPVTTATSGPLELVRDQVEGLVVPTRDAAAIERALRQLIDDRAMLDRLRRRAYEKAQSYSWTTIAAERLRIYEEFLSRQRSEAETTARGWAARQWI
jgi:glycosyltransferase involved in cell wall biosynthesis